MFEVQWNDIKSAIQDSIATDGLDRYRSRSEYLRRLEEMEDKFSDLFGSKESLSIPVIKTLDLDTNCQ